MTRTDVRRAKYTHHTTPFRVPAVTTFFFFLIHIPFLDPLLFPSLCLDAFPFAITRMTASLALSIGRFCVPRPQITSVNHRTSACVLEKKKKKPPDASLPD
ncbi:hypothetical protein BCV70DRAFT_35660 [Testicularia cyperi]|uniref:Uncharacterized protein n=1 Tax=Testicularia cyperi TaxID=1882483 RepID=A0A317XJH0_9BASI|nr:hypothetical protein BCV70DRAFT_35660 [Testicularia cyperi]